MEALRISSLPSLQLPSKFDKSQPKKLTFSGFNPQLSSPFSLFQRTASSACKTFNAAVQSFSTEPANPPDLSLENPTQEEKFDWYAQWYPLMPVCDLDKRVPHGKKVLGIDVVVWWDRNESAWKVFDDACPHRLAPLSEGRIDQWGRLQCVYHGWCFNGSGDCKFIPQAPTDGPPGDVAASSSETKRVPSAQGPLVVVFICIPVSPGNSRLIWTFPGNFGIWIDRIVPRWMFHIGHNLVLDSDLCLLHVEERKIMEAGPAQWQKACFVPTKSDALVVGFRKWLNKYAGGQVDWRGKFSGALPPSPPREQLLDRYWSHVVNCSSCSAGYKGLKVLEVVLQVVALSLVGIVAATKQAAISVAARTMLVAAAILSFAASKWLAHFIYKQFHFHDHNHALR